MVKEEYFPRSRQAEKPDFCLRKMIFRLFKQNSRALPGLWWLTSRLLLKQPNKILPEETYYGHNWIQTQFRARQL